MARVDILEQGGRYIESTEDFLRRTGHWLETELPEEELDAQLASDFADFAEPELRECQYQLQKHTQADASA